MKKQSIITRIIHKRIFTMILLLVVLVAVFAIMSAPNRNLAEVGNSLFLKPKNLMNILNGMPLSVFLTTGVAMLMISGRLDLSTGANGTLCAMIIAYILRDGMPLIPAIIIAIAVGILVGLINAVLVNELRMAPFIATLATSYVATGLVYLLANKRTIDVVNPIMRNYGKYMIWDYIPVSMLFAFGFMIIAGVILHNTKFGRQIYIVGSNPQAAMLSGINPKRMSYTLFMICGMFSSFAGITFAARQQSANMLGISAARYQGITAAVLGGIAFGGGTGGMAGAFVGLLVLNTFSNGMMVLGFSPYWQNVANGLLLIFALMLDFFQKKQSEKIVA